MSSGGERQTGQMVVKRNKKVNDVWLESVRDAVGAIIFPYHPCMVYLPIPTSSQNS